METNVRLYTLNYDEAKTYLWAAVFVACNIVLPQVFHLVPQGGIVFAPLSLVILTGAYKLGWKTGLLAAVASPLVNNLVTGAITVTVQDFTVGWPGLLLQTVGGYLLIKYLLKR